LVVSLEPWAGELLSPQYLQHPGLRRPLLITATRNNKLVINRDQFGLDLR
jgi:hypothetical protein